MKTRFWTRWVWSRALGLSFQALRRTFPVSQPSNSCCPIFRCSKTVPSQQKSVFPQRSPRAGLCLSAEHPLFYLLTPGRPRLAKPSSSQPGQKGHTSESRWLKCFGPGEKGRQPSGTAAFSYEDAAVVRTLTFFAKGGGKWQPFASLASDLL